MGRHNRKSESEAEIYISGDIIDDAESAWMKMWLADDDGSVSGYVWPDDIKKQLDDIDDDADLTVYINSDGGSVPAGVAVANMIARHKGHTKAIVGGWCCSIATQIFFSADERAMPENAYLMIHKPMTAAYGNADDLQKAIDMLNVIQEGLEKAYIKAAKEGTTPQQISEMVDAETWLTGVEAADYFDITLLKSDQTAACASGRAWNDERFHNMPDCLKSQIKTMERDPGIPVHDSIKPKDPKKENEHSKEKAAIALALANASI